MRRRIARIMLSLFIGVVVPVAITMFVGSPSHHNAAARVETGAVLVGIPSTESVSPTLLRLRVGVFDPLHTSLAVPQTMQRTLSDKQSGLRLLQFSDPVQDTWYAAMVEAGFEIVSYLPDYAYLVWGDYAALSRLQTQVPLRWDGLYHPYYALHPALSHTDMLTEEIDVVVQVYDCPETRDIVDAIVKRASRVLRSPYTVLVYRNVGISVAVSDLTWLAGLSGVVSVEPLPEYHKLDEIQGQILAGYLDAAGSQVLGPGYLNWLTATLGFTTSPEAYPVVDITDDGIDDGDDVPNHPDFYEFGDTSNPDRLVYNHNWTYDPLADGVGGHGNINASIVGGYNDKSGAAYEDGDGYNYGLGINPFGRIAGSKIFVNDGPFDAPAYTVIIGTSYDKGARISSNSWGEEPGTGAYLSDDQAYDVLVRDALLDEPGNQEMLVLFAAGNSGNRGNNTTGSPANAKNVIAVGAEESVRPTWTDGCSVAPAGADNANDIISFSSRGPTDDGRVKPDLVAPGTHIQGAASQTVDYTGRYICDPYYPAGQILYGASSGTSHATPAVAGAAALFYRYYQDRFGDMPPSPAMTKAYFVNSARYLDGVGSGDTLPSNSQGFGALDLGGAFDQVARILVDQDVVLHESGDIYVLQGGVDDPDKPFRITLAWTDAPGPVVGDAYVNNLDLEMSIGDKVYRGNVFSGATSVTGGDADPRNNVESIFLPVGTYGTFTLRVKATNIAGDGLPGDADFTDQDFALVCYNCVRHADFDLRAMPAAQTVCAPAEAVYTLTTRPVMSLTGDVALEADGVPAAASAVFQPNPVTIGNASRFIISSTGAVAAGTYAIDVVGTALAHSHTTTVQLQLFNMLPVSPGLLSPLPASVNVDVYPTLVWEGVEQATTYYLEVATDPALATLVVSPTLVHTAATSVLSYILTIPLAYDTTYYWRVTPGNGCGSGPSSVVSSFTTRSAPPVFCSASSVAIPDNAANGITDLITLSVGGTLLDLTLAVTATHSWIGDLRFTLEHLDTGTLVTLLDRPGIPPSLVGCSGSNMDVIVDDSAALTLEDNCADGNPAYMLGASYRPNISLSQFEGESLLGTWALHVSDHASQDTGTLDQWCLVPTLDTDPARPHIVISPTLLNIEEGGPAGTYQVTIDRQPTTTVTLTLTYDDQVVVVPEVIVFQSGTVNLPHQVTVTAVDDAVPEGVRTHFITHTTTCAGLDCAVLDVSTVSVTIFDNETAAGFTHETYAVNKTDGAASVSVALDAATHTTVTVNYATNDDTAIAGTDYMMTTGTLTFAPGILTGVFTVPILDNPANTTSRTVALALADPNPSSLLLASRFATLRIWGYALPDQRVYLPLVLKSVECSATLCLRR